MYAEDDLLMLSALQHLLFCERQCALIHIEQIWVENLFTTQGRLMHERVDQQGHELRRDLRQEYGMPVRSLQLGLSGKADVVEFHREADSFWRPYPVEYKRGRSKKEDWDRVQLCAQALCLEEMLHVEIPEGALFYGKKRRREKVVFNDDLRMETRLAAEKLHRLTAAGITPAAKYDKKCDNCSLVDICLPKITAGRASVSGYLDGKMAVE